MYTDTPTFPKMFTTQKKWTHLQDGSDWIWSVAQTIDVVSTIELHRWVGLAVPMTEIYADAGPYLNGVFNALESFCWNRDDDGW